MSHLVSPQLLVFNSKGRISGFNDFVSEFDVPQWTLLETALEVVEDWSSDWPDGEGFGSSDMTFMVKDFIDRVIYESGNGSKYMTDFTPSLSVVEYSEMNYHNRVQRMESGL